MSATNSLHYQLCCDGAKYLLHAREPWQSANKWATVEIIVQGYENPDVWATNGTTSTIIEVKTSHADFLADKQKYSRSEQAEQAGHTLGNYRYYLCPENLIHKEELPQHWGLLYWNGKKIVKVEPAEYIETNKKYDMFILSSILHREVGIHKIFNYRK